ncbi:dolichyl-P-Glc:Glc1Man(9)GlcNAc(2)-PP-dolichol alpha-1,3-glucosyltransferase [Pichia kluyveri]|uniref:Alpha-1,3-glucosyltransferase n=1 Tax=Pichia kluyveri TaxID=36015 RepID=A0AAV5R619_PICKL|nr:dolichyl-P-Glc:Glc1Man(9)GlcNAc(2)-PP-dolichol alpha-1,3-glucosyltransferase [Pichia kluyveri]
MTTNDSETGSIHRNGYNYSLWNIWVASTLLKILLFPTLPSHDFNVYRNWISITNLIPLKDWYNETLSPYPLKCSPFFAYSQWILSKISQYLIISDNNNNNYSMKIIIFQRSTVIISEILLFLALQWFIDISKNNKEKRRNFVISASIVLSPGLFIIDHINFQFNGFLFGILILSLINAKLGNYLKCSFWFTILICFKSNFIFISPAYLTFLISSYCLNPIIKKKSYWDYKLKDIINIINWINLIKLSITILLVLTIAFTPFIYYGVINDIFNRLFDNSQLQITNNYWAPNVWALYSFTDKLLILLNEKLPILNKLFSIEYNYSPNKQFKILPNIENRHTFLLIIFYQIMSIIPIIFQPNFERLVGSISLCGYSYYLFGWHIEEKFIMMIIIPLTFVICQDRRLLPSFQLLTSSGYISLFPILKGSNEWMFKSLITFVWFIVFQTSFSEVTHFSRIININTRVIVLDRLNLIYMLLFAPLCIIIQLINIINFNFNFDLNYIWLIVYSIYCSFGVISSWSSISWLYFLDDPIWIGKD